VSFGAVLDGETVTIPAFHRIGAPGTASLLQLLPIAATTSWLEAILVAAVTPPSALHPESSPTNLTEKPSTAFLSSMAISIPRRLSTPSDPSGPATTSQYASVMGCPVFTSTTPTGSVTGPIVAAGAAGTK